jgi:hypothetical protein
MEISNKSSAIFKLSESNEIHLQLYVSRIQFQHHLFTDKRKDEDYIFEYTWNKKFPQVYDIHILQ